LVPPKKKKRANKNLTNVKIIGVVAQVVEHLPSYARPSLQLQIQPTKQKQTKTCRATTKAVEAGG
jgi:hypothetical protein